MAFGVPVIVRHVLGQLTARLLISLIKHTQHKHNRCVMTAKVFMLAQAIYVFTALGGTRPAECWDWCIAVSLPPHRSMPPTKSNFPPKQCQATSTHTILMGSGYLLLCFAISRFETSVRYVAHVVLQFYPSFWALFALKLTRARSHAQIDCNTAAQFMRCAGPGMGGRLYSTMPVRRALGRQNRRYEKHNYHAAKRTHARARGGAPKLTVGRDRCRAIRKSSGRLLATGAIDDDVAVRCVWYLKCAMRDGVDDSRADNAGETPHDARSMFHGSTARTHTYTHTNTRTDTRQYINRL